MSRLTYVLIMVALVEIIACGGGDTKSLIELALNPEQPVVITAPIKIYIGTDWERTVEPPWFKYVPTYNNQSDKTITVVAIKHKISIMSGATMKKVEVNVASLTGTYLDEVPPKTQQDSNWVIYVGGLPEAVNDNYSYTVEIIVQGWYGPWTDPEERLDLMATTVTQ